MFKSVFRNYVYPIATLSGSIIGVGFLSLPYITLRVGILPMIFYVILLTGIIVVLHVIFGQVCLNTPDYKRFPGFAEFYLGKWAKYTILASVVFGSFGLFIVYFILGKQFLTAIVPPFAGNVWWYVAGYFGLGMACIYFGIKIVSRAVFWALALLLVVFFIIGARAFSYLNLESIFLNAPSFFGDWKTMFLPYGIVVFSLWGAGLIPEIEEMVAGNKWSLKRIIITATIIPAAEYLIFIFLILGISGTYTTESALTGLKGFLSPGIFGAALSIGLITIFNAVAPQGLFLKETLMYDLGIRHFPAWLITCLTPMFLFLLGFNSFIFLISFIGGVFLGINGIFILLMYRKIGGKKIIVYPLALVFILGIMYEIV